jgi:hypothetical protein
VAARARRSLATAVLTLLFACPSLALAGSSSPPAPAPLAAGRLGTYSWTVEASRLAGSRPCVVVAITHHHGPFSYDRSKFRDCVPGSTGFARSTPPLVVGGVHQSGADGSRMTVFGILAPGNARKVRATVSDDPGAAHVNTRLEPVAPTADRTLGLRFAAIALPGSHCVERVATENAVGRALWRGTTGDLCAPLPESEDTQPGQ